MSQNVLVKSSYIKALWISIALHVLIVLILFVGDFSSEPKPAPTPVNQSAEPIKAVVVDQAKYEEAINKIKKQKFLNKTKI